MLDVLYFARMRETLGRDTAPDREELEALVRRVAERVGWALERMGLLQRDTKSAWLDVPSIADTDAMTQLLGNSVTYRIALGPQAGRKAPVAARDQAAGGPGSGERADGEGRMDFHAAHPSAAPLRGSLWLCKSAVLPICRHRCEDLRALRRRGQGGRSCASLGPPAVDRAAGDRVSGASGRRAHRKQRSWRSETGRGKCCA